MKPKTNDFAKKSAHHVQFNGVTYLLQSTYWPGDTTDEGYLLYTENEWNTSSQAELEVTPSGTVSDGSHVLGSLSKLELRKARA